MAEMCGTNRRILRPAMAGSKRDGAVPLSTRDSLRKRPWFGHVELTEALATVTVEAAARLERHGAQNV